MYSQGLVDFVFREPMINTFTSSILARRRGNMRKVMRDDEPLFNYYGLPALWARKWAILFGGLPGDDLLAKSIVCTQHRCCSFLSQAVFLMTHPAAQSAPILPECEKK